MDLTDFLEPPVLSEGLNQATGTLGAASMVFEDRLPNWQAADLILLGCASAEASATPRYAADAIREQLYGLSLPHPAAMIADIGNLRPDLEGEDFYEALGSVMAFLIEEGKTLVLLGNEQDCTLGQFLGYTAREVPIEYVHVDARLDLEDSDIILDRASYNHRILHLPGHTLFHYCNLGYQRYFVQEESLHFLKSKNYETVRYGLLHRQKEATEPYLRMADMVSIDASAIRATDIPGAYRMNPSGFSAMEISRLARYAGMGYQTSSLSISEYDPQQDPHRQGSLMLAMLVWYFIDGFYHKPHDQPLPDRSNLRQYAVQLHASIEAIHFYQHLHTGRWWMEVPFQEDLGHFQGRSRLVPCAYSDYEKARQDEIPEKWWLTYNKLT